MTPSPFVNETNFGPARFANIASLINIIIPFLLIALAVIFLVMLLLGAFTWITSGGTPENLKKAQKIFTFAVMGLVIVLLSFAAVRIINLLLGLDTSSNFLPI